MSRADAEESADYGDNPWRRTPAEVAASLLIWLLLLWAFGTFLDRPVTTSPTYGPLQADLVEYGGESGGGGGGGAPGTVARAKAPEPVKSVIPKPAAEPLSPEGIIPVDKTEKPVESAPPVIASPPSTVEDAVSPGGGGPGSGGGFGGGTGTGYGPGTGPGKGGVSGKPYSPPYASAAYGTNPKPDYPPIARKLGKEGTVVLNVLVGRDGYVVKLEVDRSSGTESLDMAAYHAVKKWRFNPAKMGDSPVEAWVKVPMVFAIR